MAKARNLILDGVSGKIGDMLVIRQSGGKTIISQAPGERQKAATEAQQRHQRKFQEAVIYGKSQLADETARAEYGTKASGMRTAFNVAVADFLHAPDIDEIDLTQYNGHVGDTIRVRAIDDFKVVAVNVQILNADTTLVEEGAAIQQENTLDWIYTATVENEFLEGDRIVVQASDKPGHISTEEKSL